VPDLSPDAAPSGWDVASGTDVEGGVWLGEIAQRIAPADGNIGAMHHVGSGSGEWRLVAYIGTSWENAGDGWVPIPTTGTDPVSQRDAVVVEALWNKAIIDSRSEHEAKVRGAKS
jgi:hypothetical protein